MRPTNAGTSGLAIADGASMAHEKILVAFDFGPLAEPLLVWSAEIARRLEGTVSVLHVVFIPPVASPPMAVGPMYPAQEQIESLRRKLQEIATGLRIEAPIEIQVAGHVGDAIIGAAESQRADLIAMGTHGGGLIARAFLGSVADYVVRHANCPVITMRAAPSNSPMSATT